MELLAQTIVNGLLIGGVYIAIAVGFSLAFGVMHVIDFAVGEWVIIGALLGWTLTEWLGIDPLFVLVPIAVVFWLLGWVIQPLIRRVVTGDRPLPVLMGLVFTFGIAILVQAVALFVWGINRRSIASSLGGQALQLHIGGLGFTVPVLRLVMFMYGMGVVLVAGLLLRRTRLGIAVRAAAQNPDMAGLLGVNVDWIGRVIYAGYAAVTGMAGVFIGMLFAVSPEIGLQYTTFAFFTVVLAGMGYVPGVPVAGLTLGLLQSAVAVYWGPRYVYLAVFFALYLVLLISPRGILRRGWA
ncbi:MAG TPA: branched-chain amino acid ABC transporter permease [Anaerolineae bacterium]|nr:branched-chain amino acid ABC transporter permease [Anaerolineae bacterium]